MPVMSAATTKSPTRSRHVNLSYLYFVLPFAPL